MSTPVFWMEQTGLVRVSLRRYHDGDNCPAGGYCGASVVIVDQAPLEEWTAPSDHFDARYLMTRDDKVARDDPRWPTACSKCGVGFLPGDAFQVNHDRLHSGCPDGKLYTLRDAPPGAMWDAWWMSEWHRGPDGICLVVRLPNGSDWMVDDEASNCTRPQRTSTDGRTYRSGRTHYCWVRHGDPRDPQGLRSGQPLHVDKDGDTCAAGAGSILSGSYHGFLHRGHLT